MTYPEYITESEVDLQILKKKQALVVNRNRIQFLTLLKTGQAHTQTAAGEAIGICPRQAQRLWQRYRTKGLGGLLMPAKRLRWGKLSSQQISHLRKFLLDDQAQTLAHIQTYLKGNLGVNYSISGVGSLCKRLKIKCKTGRPVNVRQVPGAVEGFKKNFAS
jgi:transposase